MGWTWRRVEKRTCNHYTNIVWKVRITFALLNPNTYHVVPDILLSDLEIRCSKVGSCVITCHRCHDRKHRNSCSHDVHHNCLASHHGATNVLLHEHAQALLSQTRDPIAANIPLHPPSPLPVSKALRATIQKSPT